MKFCFLVTFEQPDAWVTSASGGDGLKGVDWCTKTLGDALAATAANLIVHAPGFDSRASVESCDLVASVNLEGDGGTVQ